jgi:glucan phosphoethanolaminetransferase (alkaline phosphatase superfamily)
MLRCLSFFLLLTIVDIYNRYDFIYIYWNSYFYNMLPLFCFLYILKNLIPEKSFTTKIISSVVIGSIYAFQYIYYSVYKQFIQKEELAVLFNNFKYWSTEGSNLFSFSEYIHYFVFFILIFYIYLSKIPKIFPSPKISKSKFNFKHEKKVKVILAALILIGSRDLTKVSGASFLESPFLFFYHHIKSYAQARVRLNKETKFYTKNKHSRKKDSIPEFARRGDFNVLFVVNESVSAKYTSLFGSKDNTTPYQRKHFSESFLFPKAISNTTFTGGSLSTIFSGINYHGEKGNTSSSLLWHYAKQANLKTFYISSLWSEWNDMDTGYLDYPSIDYVNSSKTFTATLGRYDHLSVSIFSDEIKKSRWQKPFLGVINFSNTHYPYYAPDKFKKWTPAKPSFKEEEIAQSLNQYKNSILYVDHAMNKVIESLKENNLFDNTIIIATSDHGDAFYEHDQCFHGKVFWQEVISVPFYLHIPPKLLDKFTKEELNNLKANSKRFISNVDIFPTILDIYNIPQGKKFSGHSLLKYYPQGYSIASFANQNHIVIINNQTGDKYYLNNETKRLMHVNLNKDPNENHPNYSFVKENFSVEDLIAKVEKDKLLSKL